MQENPRDRGRFRRNMTMAAVLALLCGTAPAVGAPGVAAPAQAPASPPSFARDVAPILNRWCVSCHGPEEDQGGLRLDSYEATLKGGDDGPVLVAGDPKNSQLVAQIERRVRPPMPPKKRLPRDPTATIRAWILSGAAP